VFDGAYKKALESYKVACPLATGSVDKHLTTKQKRVAECFEVVFIVVPVGKVVKVEKQASTMYCGKLVKFSGSEGSFSSSGNSSSGFSNAEGYPDASSRGCMMACCQSIIQVRYPVSGAMYMFLGVGSG
jgi:hypothetical protein